MFAWLRRLVSTVKAARTTPERPKDAVVVHVPEHYGPVVESRDLKTPLPVTRVPVRSTRGDAKRHAKRVVEAHEGKPLSNKQVKRRIKKLSRDPEVRLRDVADPKKRSTLPQPPDAA